MPYDLYISVKKDIPNMVGVLIYSGKGVSLVKKPIRQKQLTMKDNVMLRNLLNSMNREVFKAKQVEKGLQRYNTEVLMKEIIKRTTNSKSDFLVDLILQTYSEDKKKFIKLLIDNSICEEYKELILSVMSKEFYYLNEDVKELKKEYREERRLKREAWGKIKALEYGFYVDEGLGNHLIVYYSEQENKVISVHIDRVTLCQYTGRNDRTGKEIYERDRLWNEYMETYGVVSFQDGKFVFNWENVTEDLFEVESDSEVIENRFD